MKPAPQPTEDEKPVLSDSTGNNDEIEDNTKDQEVVNIGNGSGQIVIKNTSDKNYHIKQGTYWNITIENASNISVTGAGKVNILSGDINIRDVNELTVSGITIEECSQTAINIFGDANNLTLKDLIFKNINNYVISFNKNVKYDGSPESFSENIRLLNIQADNISTLFVSAGSIQDDGFRGLIKGFELSGSSIKNSPHLSNGLYLNLVEDYKIFDNTIDNVNSQNNIHNGIFHLIGNGKIFANKATNHQGNLVRAWLFSISKLNALVEIYDNVVYNSSRYGAFELQVTPYIESVKAFKPADAKIYNNTIGRMNTAEPKYFEGRVLDLYNTHGTLEIYNNLYFDMRDSDLINNMSGSTKITKNTNNKYIKKATDAVYDLNDFKSKILGIGAK